jgi:CBS domain-containing protein
MLESALGAALNAGGENTRGSYRRAWGAAREAMRESSSALDRLPERPPIGSIHQLPKADIAALAAPILSLVGEMQFYAVMGASTQVIVVDMDSPLSVAFIAATESRVSSVLLWDGTSSTFAGMLTVTDYIRILLHCHESSSSSAASVATMSVRELMRKDWLKGSRRAQSSVFVWGTPNLSVLDCLSAMMHHKVNRLPVLASKAFEEDNLPADIAMGINPANPSAPCPPPPTSFSVISVVTFQQLLAHIGRVLLTMGHGENQEGNSPGGSSTPRGQDSLYDVPLRALKVGRHADSLANGTIPKLSRNDTVADALRVMIDHAVHAVGILDINGHIVDVVTRSDVLRMESGGAYDVTLTLAEALAWRPAQSHAVVCSLNDSFGDVLAHFVNTWVKEVFVVDPETDAVTGQLSMKELLEFLFDAATSVPTSPAS